MKIAIASGKGGTGKTTIATNLAVSISQESNRVEYIDCDVEEPNGHIFLKPDITRTEDVTVSVPSVNNELCIHCGKCGQLCQYSAITCLKNKVLVFEGMCHSCGGCMEICPARAITEKQRKIGIAEFGKSKDVYFRHGKLDIGTIQTPALIRYIKNTIVPDAITIIDAPPGTSCPVVETIKQCDFVLLVTEPTPFGLNDLILAVDMVKALNIPFSVGINRCDVGDTKVLEYCRNEGIEVDIEIPNDRRIAESYSRGIMMIEQMPEYKEIFKKTYQKIFCRINS